MAQPPPAKPIPTPRRGQIWFIKSPTDPLDKDARPVIVVSADGRNQHARANTVLVVPLSTTLSGNPAHVLLQPGETGLIPTCEAQGENITVVSKTSLLPAKTTLRTQNEATIKRIAAGVVIGMGLLPEDLK
jgi:mRNA-degrading endonuclease toxin of MazEF toxin-antitoxin module